MGRKGNPAWHRGMPSANPKGRPRGQSGLASYCERSIRIYFLRWERFCFALMQPPYTGAAAGRKAGYSPKSVRFIASRLRRNPVVREILRRIKKRIDGTIKIGDGVYLIPDDDGRHHIYRNKNIRKEAEEYVKARIKYQARKRI